MDFKFMKIFSLKENIFTNEVLYKMYSYYNKIIFNNEMKHYKCVWTDKLYNAAGICC